MIGKILNFGDHILGYEIVELISTGEFGGVYKGVKKESGQVCAIKHIVFPSEKQYMDTLNSMNFDYELTHQHFKSILDQVIQEINVILSLSEKNPHHIKNYYDIEMIKEEKPFRFHIYLSMEYLTQLNKFVNEHVFTIHDVITLGVEVLDALDVFHQNELIHCDLNEGNIFVNKNGQFKIGDFGVSKIISKKMKATYRKPYYLAPELLNKQEYDKTVDIYSIGAILYKIVNHYRNPFLPMYPDKYDNRDIEEAFKKKMTYNCPDLPSNCPRELGEILVKAISPKNIRYQSTKEFKQALLDYRATLPENILNLTINDEEQQTQPKEPIDFEVILNAESETIINNNVSIDHLPKINSIKTIQQNQPKAMNNQNNKINHTVQTKQMTTPNSNLNYNHKKTNKKNYLVNYLLGFIIVLIVLLIFRQRELTKDMVAPEIIGLKTNWTLDINDAKPNYLKGVEAYDHVDGKVSVEIVEDQVQYQVPGQYKVTIKAVDSVGNKTVETIYVTVISTTTKPITDQIAPVIYGTHDWNLMIGDAYPDFLNGVSAEDNQDGYVQVTIKSNNVNINQVGTYHITYQAVDSSNNVESQTVTVTVHNPSDQTAPIVSGHKDWTLYVGDAMPNFLSSITAYDSVDGNVEVSIIENTVRMDAPGTYKVTYRAVDKSNNYSTQTVQVIVKLRTVTPNSDQVTLGTFTLTRTGNILTYKPAITNTTGANITRLENVRIKLYYQGELIADGYFGTVNVSINNGGTAYWTFNFASNSFDTSFYPPSSAFSLAHEFSYTVVYH